MKSFIKLLLALSILGNAALALVLVQGALEKAAGPDSRPAAKATTDGSAAKAPEAPQVWATVATDDLAVLPDRLRNAGFPPHIVRAILAAQLHRDFAARRKAIEGARDATYWKSEALDPKKQIELRQLSREEQKELRTLLGPEADNDGYSSVYRDRGLSGVPPEKADLVRNVIRDFDEQRQDFYLSLQVGGSISMTPADTEKLRAIEKAQHAEIAKVLSPAELENYDLVASNTAQSLRYQLTAFDATEQEFRTLFKLQRDFEDRLGGIYGPMSQDDMRARNEAQNQLNEQIKLALGPDRFADYQRSTDYNYRQTSLLVTRLELPADTTNQLYAVQKEYQEKLQTMQKEYMENRRQAAEAAPSRDELMRRLTALQQEAIDKVTPLLGGTRGVEAYKQYGGQWISNMVPRMPQRSPGSATPPKT